MDHVIVGDNCYIKNSILCSNVNIKSKCNVSDCQIGTGTHVEEGKVASKEVLTNLSSDNFFSKTERWGGRERERGGYKIFRGIIIRTHVCEICFFFPF